jgi:hypothetical protein
MEHTQDVVDEEEPFHEEGVIDENYEDTFAELNRRAASNHHHHTDHLTEELDALEYSQDHEEPVYGREEGGGHTHPQEEDDREIYADDHHEDEEEEEEEEETDDDDDDDDDQQGHVEPSTEAQGKHHPSDNGNDADAEKAHLYENKFTKPVLKLGKTSVSVGEARLFGLLGRDGQVKLDVKKGGREGVRSKAEVRERRGENANYWMTHAARGGKKEGRRKKDGGVCEYLSDLRLCLCLCVSVCATCYR